MALIDRYDVLRRLGRGAAGDVFLARDRIAGGREVALKTIRARVDDVLRAAFEREFLTMASLSLPGVAQVHDFGVMHERAGVAPSPFFTRTYIDGDPIDEAARDLDVAGRVALFTKVAHVASPLHRAGVVHGDIKPGNAIVDGQGRAWLIDFGLSRMRGYDRSLQQLGPAGTPAFMAPELLRGEALGVAADIYALGVTLWVLLLGEAPFAGLGARAVQAKLDGKLPEVPVRCDAETRAALAVAQRAMAANPLDRYPSVDELIVSLERLSVTHPAETTPPTAPRPFVLPRPRGHAQLLREVESAITKRSTQSAVWLVQAPAGGGKSLFLRELKWRLQLGSQLVFELFAGRAAGARPLLALLDQLVVALGVEHPHSRAAADLLAALRAGRLDESATSDALEKLLSAVANETSVVVCVDDLDHGDAVMGAILRSAVRAESARGVAVVVTAERAQAAAVRELHPEHVLELPRLSREDSAALIAETLGPVDASVIAALAEHSQGLPGALVSALFSLSTLRAVTPADVHRLPPAEAALALTGVRLAQVPQRSRPLLHALSLLTALPEGLVSDLLMLLGSPTDAAKCARLLSQLESSALIVRDAGAVMLHDRSVRDGLLVELAATGQQRMAELLLTAAWSQQIELVDRAHLAVLAGSSTAIVELAPSAVRALTQVGAHAAAAELLIALIAHSTAELQRNARLDLVRTRHTLGEDESAVTLAKELARDAGASVAERAEAALLAARALTALGRYDDAVSELGLVPGDVEAAQRAGVQRELAKIHLRRGDYTAVEQAAEAGLACAAAADPVRVELLCSQGMAASYRGDQAAARERHEAALRMARAHGSRRDEANALAYLAIGCQYSGDMVAARDLLAQSLEIARELGDVGNMANYSLNLGAVMFYLGEPAAAAEHYESAVRLAGRAGRLSTQAQARTNLAHIHLYFGLYETARGEIDQVLRDPETTGHKFIAAQATTLFADLLARTGQVDEALIHYDDAIARYTKLGQSRELAERHLDAAEALLDRGGPVDASAAAARLATAREQIERDKMDDLRLRVELLIARARLANEDADGAVDALRDIAERARKAHDRDAEWMALCALSLGHEQLGSRFGARRNARLAVEALEEIALRVPREHREAFWHDPRRRAVRERAKESSHSEQAFPTSVERGDSSMRTDAFVERERLLEIIKRLASEHDQARLLERITESAVELSGAERGSVLLVGADGNLAPEVTRVRMPVSDEAHALFSRSIAEAVLIDGEPIVTVDAATDGRLQSYVSVHKLMLRSVACLPIRGRTATLGVLYLEHRRSRGKFSDSAVDLLCAFADQAAIAIENTRLIAQTCQQKLELEEANRELSRAKAELEDALVLRMRQLDDVQRELSRTSRQVTAENRHGLVGKSAAIQRVFDGIARLAVNAVPVVVSGESGTGKELVARAMHYGGPRAAQPFVAISCGSMPDMLLESELFGHVKGAFTGADRDKRGMIAAAAGGTLFLDEVSEMSPKMQVGLLRVLQERKVCRLGGEEEEPVDVRLIAASQRPLSELVARGSFREDLYYRLSVVELQLPALRERREDVPLLCEHFLREFAARESVPRRHLSRAALARLMEHPWPGNVRQLSHVLLQACVMAEGSGIDVGDLALGDSVLPPPPRASTDAERLLTSRIETLDHHKLDEKQRILDALAACGWNRVRAAQALGMPRRTFYRRLTDYSIL